LCVVHITALCAVHITVLCAVHITALCVVHITALCAVHITFFTDFMQVYYFILHLAPFGHLSTEPQTYHPHYMFLIHADGLLCLQLHTVGSEFLQTP